MEANDFWDDNKNAQKIISQSNKLKAWTVPYNDLKKRFDDTREMLPEADEMGDEDLLNDLLTELSDIEQELSELETRKMLSGELDNKNCFISINSGAGGTESCDWAAMLHRMYMRWAQKKGWKVEQVDYLDGDVAGIKSATLKIIGPFAYGYAKAEKGVHRLVRISPFDSNAKRHTSFASVEIIPEIEDDIQIEIKPEEIRIDTYRASGAGGQHVNKTDSAVRITHLKTNIVVTCQNQRSQLQNKETCFKILRSKLYELEVQEREARIRNESGEKKDIGWGNQIRNYVFQPYSMVKDTRTGHQEGDVQGVMDGNLDAFIITYLKEFG
ncbi:MAG: Peptide chain release factor 2 [Chlamydiae bacterium]|nr:Peptide chain release factor 2 [Chlamydiota bacterium]